MKTMNEIIEQIYLNCKCICDDTHEQYLDGIPFESEIRTDDEVNPFMWEKYDNYYLYKDKYAAWEKANECSDARWQDYTDDAIYECGFTEEELELGYYYINKTLYPQAQLVRTKHARRKTI